MKLHLIDGKISPARKCAQIKQTLRLAECVHPEKSTILIVGYNDGWVEYCTDCDKVSDKDSNYLLGHI